MSRKKVKKEIGNVEFSNEFGDLNAAKNFEIPAANKNKENTRKKK